MSIPASYFDQLFADSQDPWAFSERWYEQRKRDLTLASLPHQHYANVFEPGCANGELSRALAARSTRFLGMDICARAVALARARLAQCPQARVEVGAAPGDWPAEQFDLIVLSELGYYLDGDQWQQLVQQARHSLRPRGTLIACHWLHPIEGCALSGRQVHELLDQHLALPRLLRHEERDFLLEVWTADADTLSLEERLN